jgi:tetratricopeptide (TPR) repeat protein
MSTKRLTSHASSLSTQTIQRFIWIVLVALLVLVAAFGGYYYYDRWLRPTSSAAVTRPAAVDQMEQAITAQPNDPEPRLALSAYYMAHADYGKAYDLAATVAKAFPDNEGAWLLSGESLVRLKQGASAIAPLQQFIDGRKDTEAAPRDQALEEAYYFQGEAYMQATQPAAAQKALLAALAITPTDADALYQLGLALAAQGQHDKALERYLLATALVPDFTEVYTAMIDSYKARGQADYAAYATGMQAYGKHDYAAAKTALESATRLLPNFGPAFLGLGLTYEQLGNVGEAIKAVKRAAKLDPKDLAASQTLSRLQHIDQRTGVK